MPSDPSQVPEPGREPLSPPTSPSPLRVRRERHAHGLLWRLAILVFGLAISAAVAGTVRDMLDEEESAQRAVMRQSISAALQSHIDRKLGLVRSLRGLFESSDFVSADEFRRFARIDPAIRDGQAWFSVVWAPRHQGQQQSVPGNRAGQSGFAPGDLFPITYREPAALIHGFQSAATDDVDLTAMQQAALLRRVVITEPRAFGSAAHGGMLVKAFMPVFHGAEGTPGTLQGFLIGSIGVNGFFDDFLRGAAPDPNVSVRIRDGDRMVYARGPEVPGNTTAELLMGDRQWQLRVERTGEAIASGLWLPILVFVIGLALTALLYLRLLRSDHEYRRISQEVGLATSELASANARLAERSTALQRVADDLRRTSNEAQLANAAKTMFLANMSHELRTPLNAIIGFSEIIAARTFGDSSPRYLEYAHDIEASGRYLLSIIESLLDMSRVELGQLRLDEEAIRPAELIGSALKLAEHRAWEKRITIRAQGFEQLPRVQGDLRMLRQSLINLLINAIKFSPVGGVIELRGEVEPEGRLALFVQDHGIGIKAEELAHVFQPFWQNEAYRRKTKDGVGLGLAITKHLVEAHGGTVELHSGEGRGTLAVIHLPASRVLRSKPQLAVIEGGHKGSAA